ncbi:MAG: CpXC domain-containing protein [Anaerolineales bacterium]|nr:CpXC domain-containing protein [Anaerolineales bacterium]MDW8227122.1 CpXC domain-containing protein [Anaerolineales bacterium]
MPPQKTQIACPQCRQPVPAIVEQLFDVTSDPGAKQRLLGNVSNYVVCRVCGFSGPLATPIVYHDAEKELLLTYFPPELKLSVNEQEKIVGPLITQVVNKLPPEKRKAYLLQPKNFLTYQSFIEYILKADGITPEMLQAQQKRVRVLERLLMASGREVRSQIIAQESSVFDAEFFALFNRLAESALTSADEQSAQQIVEIQKQLLEETEYGRRLVAQNNEIQEAIKSLQAAGKHLTREKLLDLFLTAPNDDRLSALVSLTRPAVDYLFFQELSERIEKAKGEQRSKLELLRQKLLEITNRIDKRIEEEYQRASRLLETILNATDITKAANEKLPLMNDIFLDVLNRAVEEANAKQDTVRLEKLRQIVAVVQQASTPPEVLLLQELLEYADEDDLARRLEEHAEAITPEFSSAIANIMGQMQAENRPMNDQEQEVLARLETIYRAVLRFSMKKNLEQSAPRVLKP